MKEQSGRCAPSGSPDVREVVIFSDEISRTAHKGLYNFDDGRYIRAEEDIVSSAVAVGRKDVDRIHIAAGWEDILRLALWTKDRPRIFDVVSLVRKAGIADSETAPFTKADPADLLPWLYYGKRFDVLRKICNAARKRAGAGLNRLEQHIYIHLTSEDTGQIIASSL
jgi:hypothetical protein